MSGSGNGKVDSNITGLRYSEEATICTLPLPANQIWYELEPNSYGDFGGSITNIARNPINPSRQRKKGVTTDVESSGSFPTDLTQTNVQDLMQGFMFASFRRKAESGQNGLGVVTSVSGTQYVTTGTGFTAFRVGDIVTGSGFAVTANNGIRVVSASTTTTVSAPGLSAEATPPSGAKIVVVGFEFGTGEVDIVTPGGAFPRLTRVSGTKDFTQLGITPGEMIFLGGDAAGTAFNGATNSGLCRVRSVGTTFLEFDKTSGVMVAEVGTAKTIRIFLGRVLKNEVGTLIRRRTYQVERTLGYTNVADPTKEQAEYIEGGVPSTLSASIVAADKVTLDTSFLGVSSSRLDENDSGVFLKSKVAGVTRVPVREASAFNTSSDVSRIRMMQVSSTVSFPSALFGFADEITLEIDNNLEYNKAIGVLGAFEVSAGTFAVSGNISAYFTDVDSISAVQNNADVTLDLFLAKENAGISVDLPLVTLGEGQLDVEADQAIKAPFSFEAATGAKVDPNLNHTLSWVFFDYLPNRAQ